MCQYVSSWNAEDKERLFWQISSELSSEYRTRVMIFTIFTREEVQERYSIKLTDSQFEYLKENFIDFNTFERDHMQWLIEETLYRMREEGE
jgi:hypothetical protein